MVHAHANPPPTPGSRPPTEANKNRVTRPHADGGVRHNSSLIGPSRALEFSTNIASVDGSHVLDEEADFVETLDAS